MSSTHSIEIGQTVEVLIEQINQDSVQVRLSDGSSGVIYRREWALDNLSQSPDEVFKIGTQIRATVLYFHRDLTTWEISLRRVRVWEKAARRFKIGKAVRGRVVNVGSDNAYVQLMPGFNATLPTDEIPLNPDQPLQDALWVDDEVVGLIIDQNPDRLQITLSVRKYLEAAERIKSDTRKKLRDRMEIRNNSDFESVNISEATEEDPGQVWTSPIGTRHIEKILIVDDDSGFHIPFAAGLRQMGYQVKVTENGADGVSLALSGSAEDLVFLDVNLAGHDGVQIAQEIAGARPTLPVVLITAGDLTQADMLVDGLNVVDVVFKPVDLDEIETLIRSIAFGKWERRHALSGSFQTQTAALPNGLLAADQQNWEQSVETTLEHLEEITSASCAIVLEMETGTERIRIIGQSRHSQLNETYDWNQARFSPVRDVIRSIQEISEPDAKDARIEKRFRNLFPLCRFDSFMGLPVLVPHQPCRYGLFLFHSLPQHFTERHLDEARLAARSLALAAERQSLIESVQLFQGFALAGQLSEGLMHELGNQLTGLEQSAKDLELTTKILEPHAALSAEDLVDLREDIAAVNHINKELRELTRFYLGLIRAENRAFDLSAMLNELTKRLRHLAREKQVEIVVESTPELSLRTMRARLQQACLNIMLNAVQQTGAYRLGGGLLIVTAKLGEPSDPYRVKIAFDDDGPGIHRQMVERIFEPGVSTRKEGSGLGLFICRNLVESLGGRVGVKDSVLFVGSRLLIELPAVLLEGAIQ